VHRIEASKLTAFGAEMIAIYDIAPQFVAAFIGAVVLASGIQSTGFAGQEDTIVQASRPWSIEDALPKNSSAVRLRKPEGTTKSTTEIGRVPLQTGSGSFGFAGETKIKALAFPDGRPVPGAETHVVRTRKPSSFVGFSLSVPTTDK
jgi:hypothetical protein